MNYKLPDLKKSQPENIRINSDISVNEKRDHKLQESKEGYISGFERKKGEYIIIL